MKSNSISTYRLNKRKVWNKESVIGLILALIPLIGYVIFNLFTIVIAFVAQFNSMENYDLNSMVWNNFQNFSEVYTDRRFWHSLGITLWIASAQFISLAIALLISYLLSKKKKGSTLFQILFFIPYICSSVAVAVMWSWIFNQEHGLLNQLLGTDFNWLYNKDTLTWCIILVTVWQAPGYGIVMYKAAFSNVNPALYEAASIDGATAFKQFIYITLPGIAPTTFYLIMSGVIAGFMTFDSVKMLAPPQWDGSAGPGDSGLTMVYYIYIKGVQFRDMPNAAVMSWFLFIITAAISITVYIIRERRLKDA